MKPGLHYDHTYSPVSNWNSVHTFLVMTDLHGWYTNKIDYVLAYPQSPLERGIYMRIPKGFKIVNA